MPAAAFTALGNMASALADVGAEVVVGPALPRIADQIKEAISNKGRQRHSCPEALQVGQLSCKHRLRYVDCAYGERHVYKTRMHPHTYVHTKAQHVTASFEQLQGR